MNLCRIPVLFYGSSKHSLLAYLLNKNDSLSILDALQTDQQPNLGAVAHPLFSITFGHTQISYLSFLQSIVSAWGLDSISTVCAPLSCCSSLTPE